MNQNIKPYTDTGRLAFIQYKQLCHSFFFHFSLSRFIWSSHLVIIGAICCEFSVHSIEYLFWRKKRWKIASLFDHSLQWLCVLATCLNILYQNSMITRAHSLNSWNIYLKSQQFVLYVRSILICKSSAGNKTLTQSVSQTNDNKRWHKANANGK